MSHSQRPVFTPALLLAGVLFLLQPRNARAESTVTYKYEDYRESAGRVGVQAQYGLIEQSLGTDAKLKLTGVIDSIAGATPTGEAPATAGGDVPLTQMHERRKAWTLDYSHQFGRTNYAVGLANSRESDYVSNGASLNTLTDFNDKNTSLLLGLSLTDDTIRVFYQDDRVKKKGWDAVVGLNQLIDPKTSLSLNLSFGHVSGYQSDPYKIITKSTELLPGVFLPLTFPENRPDKRNKWIVYAGLNHAVDSLNGALDASYRLYHDSFGTTSHTLNAAWFQKLGPHFILIPSVRLYQQGQADFYHVTLTGTNIVPGDLPNPAGPFFSADYRLSKLRSVNLGLKLVWNPTEHVHVDLAFDRYDISGRDSLTSASAYPTANIVTGGVSFTW
ncbi:MAG: DUF3570 domain-containing protein [Candidatus Didemnitutus sp.]|nr:DUF3570 domain-containing protein [Candidatus Didemnitutus sp.]